MRPAASLWYIERTEFPAGTPSFIMQKNGEEISGETGGPGEHRETIGNGAMLRKRFVWEIRLK